MHDHNPRVMFTQVIIQAYFSSNMFRKETVTVHTVFSVEYVNKSGLDPLDPCNLYVPLFWEQSAFFGDVLALGDTNWGLAAHFWECDAAVI